MINRRFEDIEKADIDGLVERRVVEHRTLDYKLTLPGKSDSEVREFAADVSSFANASGGDLLFGVEDAKDAQGRSTGIPEAAPGLGAINIEDAILRLENICRDTITPRISGVHFRAIEGFSNGSVIIARVPKSYAAPHMVAPTWRFFARNSAGKHPLDVTELRAAFVVSEALPERIARFRDERIARIVADETPIRLEGASRVVLHICPLSGFTDRNTIRLDHWAWSELPVIYAGSASHRLNFDGVLAYDETRAYTQLFRSGVIEAVNSSILSRQETVPSTALESTLIRRLDAYRLILSTAEVEGPLVVFLSLLGIGTHRLAVNQKFAWPGDERPFDRSDMLFPDALIDEPEMKSAAVLRPAFDVLWQAAGFPRCLNYDNDTGEWVRP